MSYSVGEVARLAGVSVRTLHHYDDIGLLSPGDRSPAGYRRYGERELERLQRIVVYRELGFDLDQIGAILDDPGSDVLDHLRRQHELLVDRVGRLQAMAAAVAKTMEARTMGISLGPDELFEVFGEHDPTRHAAEAEERWGETDAYRESQRRTSAYTKADWLRLKAESAAIEQDFAQAMAEGAEPGSERAMDLAEAHRLHIDRAFYPLSHELQVGLADLYVSDPRFTAHYDDVAPGLARFVHYAIHANAARN